MCPEDCHYCSQSAISDAAIANLADAAVLGIQGEGDEATERLKSAGRNLFDFVTNTLGAPVEAVGRIVGEDDVIPNIATDADFRTLKDVLSTASVPDLGSADIPILGDISGKGALGFALDVVTDPLTFTRVGSMTKAGREARRLKTAVKRPVDASGKLGSLWRAQAEAGERSLLSIGGKTVLRGPRTLGAVGNAMRKIAMLAPNNQGNRRPRRARPRHHSL